MKPPQQLLEHAVRIVVVLHSSSKGAAKRRGDSGLVRQALDTDDAPLHVMLGRRLLQVSFASH
jgi:hypothetical protein